MKTIILCFALFAFIDCNEKGNSTTKQDGVKSVVSVEVGVYIEALCPWSKLFVNSQLFPTFNKLNVPPHIMTVNLVPFGNAHMTLNKNTTKHPSVNFTCQHGKQECVGNLLQACAVVKYDTVKSLPFVNCMFNSSDWKTPSKSAAECAKKLNLNMDGLSECGNSNEGVAIEYFMGAQTKALEPPHKGVPWVTINGKHTDEIQNRATSNLLKLVCDSYQGSPKPKACESA